MVSEIRKSINSILFERVASPFYGAFLVSWCIWNWRIIYLTVFVSEEYVPPNKLVFIEKYINLWNTFLIPLGYAILLLTVGQFISNWSYWLYLHMKQWKINKRNKIQQNQLLTVDQSIQLRSEIQRLQNNFETMLNSKEEAIVVLKKQNEDLNRTISSGIQQYHNPYAGSGAGDAEYHEFEKTGTAYEGFLKVVESLKERKKFPAKLDEDIEEYYLINNIVEKIPNSPADYQLSFKGGYFHKKIFNEKFAKREDGNGWKPSA